MLIDSEGRLKHPDIVGTVGGLLVVALLCVATGVVGVGEPWRVVAIVALVVLALAGAIFMAYIGRDMWKMWRHPPGND
ncbi:hypothetical protein [uncultured Williamsia sp.]|uniref:hypothetical protein n=1 Tax=uncultured Williamsia sp. TaxID=259311 RepID=UPI002608A531|nr:hypothetical protein [uncultured Williamsia sp.]